MTGSRNPSCEHSLTKEHPHFLPDGRWLATYCREPHVRQPLASTAPPDGANLAKSQRQE